MKELQDIDLKELIEVETLEVFNRENKIHSPFSSKDKTPSFSVYYDSNANKMKFKDFSSGEQGDAIDFIMKFKNMDHKAAREYLGLDVEKTAIEIEEDKIKNFVKWQLENNKKGFKPLGIFTFVDKNNEPLYYKVKFIKSDGKKETPYYHIENGQVINKRGADEIPYNLYNVIQGINSNKAIVIVEGEKDANTINSIFKNRDYISTSIKGCKDLEIFKNNDVRILVIGDTGQAGKKYVDHIKYELKPTAKEFRIVNLPGLKHLGDNKDITDWIESGHDKNDLLNAFKRSLDLKSKSELQQDSTGIYRTVITGKDDNISEKKVQFADFQLLEASRLILVDEEREGIKLTFKSKTGKVIEKIGRSGIFDDIKSFRNFLGTIDLNFKGSKTENVVDLGAWINEYWAIENEEIYKGVKFLPVEDKLHLLTPVGSISKDGINPFKKSDKSNDINIIDKDEISKEELEELWNHIFRFIGPDKSLTIIGTIINNLAVHQAKENKVKLHHLLMVGESGSGKSTILANVIAPILNYPIKDIKSIGLITPFAFTNDLSIGNYSALYDEFKPSSLDRFKIQKISETLRNLYDRTTVVRGDKSFKTREFQFSRPIVIAGEESYPNSEKALVERSAIVYLSKNERTESSSDAMKWIIDHEDILNKFGRSLIDIVLNMTVEEYKSIREKVGQSFSGLNNRPLTTAINIASGIEIFNVLLEQKGLGNKKLIGYEKLIQANIKDEILDGGEDTKSIIEQMIVLYNNMIEDGRAHGFENVVMERKEGLFIRTTEMINQIHMFVKTVGSAELIPLKAKDFKKQATKAGYLIKASAKQIKLDGVNKKFDEYSKDKMQELKVYAIVEPELEEAILTDAEKKVIDGVFNK
ncbi:CHC2 zinc finger domain-containing protein [Clostridium sp. SHJSY1]|uniref:CHC2 zinc finger domain-containing protein n=1 Tax=Clostridium sp. SHJSY1 TaxID=2942483 RepID=UPI002874EABB|nr:CHC2 zinc finger domain-containing protein [Clostridium sp. SHJSY1]MDS0525477.1 CHC2 zinc finger domain-containing protein [Clostridium sp. SHJSY1]